MNLDSDRLSDCIVIVNAKGITRYQIEAKLVDYPLQSNLRRSIPYDVSREFLFCRRGVWVEI